MKTGKPVALLYFTLLSISSLVLGDQWKDSPRLPENEIICLESNDTNPTNSTLPKFNCNPLTDAEINETIDSQTFHNGCNAEQYNILPQNQSPTVQGFDCDNADSEETMDAFIKTLKNFAPNRALLFAIDLNKNVTQWLKALEPVSNQIVQLWMFCRPNEFSRATELLTEINLPNLLELEILGCENLDIKKSDFENSKRLRVIQLDSFGQTVRSVENGSFNSLPELQVLYFGTNDNKRMKSLQCGCDHQWFRDWIRGNPSIIYGDQKRGDVFRIGTNLSPPYSLEFTPLPTDCALDANNGTLSIEQYHKLRADKTLSINAPKCG